MRRSGFTMIEILVVIGILLLLTVLTVGVVNLTGGTSMRSAARNGQAAILGAKDRALHAKARRGIRLLKDSGDVSLSNGFVYVGPVDPLDYPLHSIQLERPDFDGDTNPDTSDVTIVRGLLPVADWFDMQWAFPFPPRIKIPNDPSGQWYTFQLLTAAPYAPTATDVFLQLTTSYVDAGATGVVIAHAFTDATHTSCQIEVGNEILPNHAPLPLPSGVVIDLFWSQIPRSWVIDQQSNPAAAPVPPFYVVEGPDPAIVGNVIIRRYADNMEIMYSPRGMVTGPLVAYGPIHFLMRDIRDATVSLSPIDPQCVNESKILTVFPQTGHVQSYDIDPTDIVNNTTGLPGADGLADDLARYAKLGSKPGA